MPGNADLMKSVKGFVLIQIIVARSGGTAVPARGTATKLTMEPIPMVAAEEEA
jgi:hypothetical protein